MSFLLVIAACTAELGYDLCIAYFSYIFAYILASIAMKANDSLDDHLHQLEFIPAIVTISISCIA
jgi:hypothetical protein